PSVTSTSPRRRGPPPAGPRPPRYRTPPPTSVPPTPPCPEPQGSSAGCRASSCARRSRSPCGRRCPSAPRTPPRPPSSRSCRRIQPLVVLLQRVVLRRVPEATGGNTCPMVKKFTKGDEVEWSSHGGTASGEV